MIMRLRYWLINTALDVTLFLAESRWTAWLSPILLAVVARESVSYALDKFHQTHHGPGALMLYLQQHGFTCTTNPDSTVTVFTLPGRPDLGRWTFRTTRKQP